MLKKIRVNGTSNLLAHNKALGLLSNGIQIEFGEFGDWAKVFTENKAQPILWVVFLEDIISPDRLFDEDSSSIKNDLDIILQPWFLTCTRGIDFKSLKMDWEKIITTRVW